MKSGSVVVVLAALGMLGNVTVGRAEDAHRDHEQQVDITFVYDLRLDFHDADRDPDGARRWTTGGFDLSTAELGLGAEADDHGRIDFNAYFFEEGAEIHELFFTLTTLPLGVEAKGGRMLADFGHWSPVHTHAMPFASEPRILQEYLGGHLVPTGLELTWPAPTAGRLVVRGGVFNAIEGHSHDTDPAGSAEAFGEDNPPPGCHYHDGQLHCPDDPEREDLYRSLLEDPDGPIPPGANKRAEDLAWLARLESGFDLGAVWSLDLGASVIHQDAHRHSQRFVGWRYAKTVAGFDATVFRTPQGRHHERNLEFGVEYLRNREQFEVPADEEPAAKVEGSWLRQTLTRAGFFTWGRCRLDSAWEFGSYLERFAPRTGPDRTRTRIGGFLTYNLSPDRKLRLEYVHDDRGDRAPMVNQVILQFDGVIGRHLHREHD